MVDAATRLYARNHELLGAPPQGGEEEASFRAAMLGLSGRYTQAHRFLSDCPTFDVLELGCGSTALGKVFSPLTRSYTMIDIVEGRLEGADQDNVRTIQANLDDDWPVESESIGVVLAMMVIEHLYDPFHAFSEVARVLKPRGRAFVNLPNIGSIKCRMDVLRGRLPNTSAPDWFERREWDGSHLHYFTVKSVRRIAELYGLALVAVDAVGNFARVKNLRPELFCHEINYTVCKVPDPAQDRAI